MNTSADSDRLDLDDCYVHSISPWDGHDVVTPIPTALALYDLDHTLLDLSTITLQHAMQAAATSAKTVAQYVTTARAVAGIATLYVEQAPIVEASFPNLKALAATFKERAATFLKTLLERSEPGSPSFAAVNSAVATTAQSVWDALMQADDAHIVDDFVKDPMVSEIVRARGIDAHSRTVAICIDLLSTTGLERKVADAFRAIWDGKEKSSLLAVSLGAEDANFARKIAVSSAAAGGNILGPDALLLSAVKVYGQSYLSHVAAHLDEAHPLRELLSNKFLKALRLPQKEEIERIKGLERLRQLNLEIANKRPQLDDPSTRSSALQDVEKLQREIADENAAIRTFFSKERFAEFKLHDLAGHNIIFSIFACIQFYDALKDWKSSAPGPEHDQHAIDLLSYGAGTLAGIVTTADRFGAAEGLKKQIGSSKILLQTIYGEEVDKEAAIAQLCKINKIFSVAEQSFAVGAAGISVISGALQMQQGIEAHDPGTITIGALSMTSGTCISLGLIYACAELTLFGNILGIAGAVVTVVKTVHDTLKSGTEKALDVMMGRLENAQINGVRIVQLYKADNDLASLRAAIGAVPLFNIPRDESEISGGPSTLLYLVGRLIALGLTEADAKAMIDDDQTLRVRARPVYTYETAMP